MTLTVRRAVEVDVEAVRAVGFATWPATYTPIAGEAYVEQGLAKWWSAEAVRESIRRGTVLVAEREDVVIGVASVSAGDDGVPMLWKLYVAPSAQGSGAGSALLAAAIAALPAGADRLRLDYLDGNEQAAAFYRARGFAEIGRYAGALDGPDEVLMELRLVSAPRAS